MPDWVVTGIKEGGLVAVCLTLLAGWWHMYLMYKAEREERKELTRAFMAASNNWKDAINGTTMALTLIKERLK
jgi:hypothetical protein